ncbi:lysophospholipase L1-like esterase [Rhodoblastus acidophilus]|uniref:SGNH/GDSL hydrolase family protein n=1 Tax=Rhodoblastus acidophilus TaxID=1074 RepID=UPI0022244283|nr:SGNH/GDSL hydrolase family protein [Rhodoblastus acidophilus]MCW2317483.1 lysophospholipase L1-like esterase [Rhodoblastus acidophilus]
MIRKLLAFLALLLLWAAPAGAAETSVNFGLRTGANPRTVCIYDASHTCVPIGALDNAAHAFLPVASVTGNLLTGSNAYSGSNTFSGAVTFNDARTAGPVKEPVGLRQVATRSYIPTRLGSWQQCMARTMHIARDDITSLRAAYASWIGQASNGETLTPQPLSIQGVSVEYPAGTFTQFKWGGSTTASQSPGLSPLSDAAVVAIPKNATFWMRALITTSTGTSGMPYTGSGDSNAGPVYPAGGDALNCGASVANQVLGGTVTDNQSNQAAIYPVALVAQTTVRSALIAGDSIGFGYRDVPTQGGDVGVIARSIGPTMAYINASVFGDSANGLANGHSARAALAAYVTDVVVQVGINDVSVGYAESTIKSNLKTIWASFPGKPVYQATYTPYASSTDAYKTVDNQTPFANDNIRQDVNDWFRTVPDANLAGVIDIADQVENYRGGGKWAVWGPNCSGYCQLTFDGLHLNMPANALIVKSGVVMNALTAGRYR